MNSIQHFLLSCPFKIFTGWDCPGCGFQRSVLLLLRGDIQESVLMYPATVPILLLLMWSIARMGLQLKGSDPITKSLLLLSIATVIISYAFKLVFGGINVIPI